jgi:glycosyltransferase involved in cell wall biosynthesis
VICEEWQTANVAIAIDGLARERGVRGGLTLMWNANNTYGWERIDWHALRSAAAITAVSKYMKFELSRYGVPSLVIPNGIDSRLLGGADPALVKQLKKALGSRPTLVKVGRFDPDKNWMQAVDALAELHAAGINARLIVRGGREPYGDAVFGRAHERGLNVEKIAYEGSDGRKVIDGIALADGPIVHLRAFLDEPTLYALYAAADAVLANSGKEPFGLVGLEVMAAGGIAVCGATGEEYAEPFVNAVVCDTADGRELATYLSALFANPATAVEMRRAGAETAARYTWLHALAALERKVAYVDAVMN